MGKSNELLMKEICDELTAKNIRITKDIFVCNYLWHSTDIGQKIPPEMCCGVADIFREIDTRNK